jgi:putative endonuclease
MLSWVYILELANGNYYIGSTRNLNQRIFDHQNGKSGYTSKFLPIKLQYSCKFENYPEAIKMEKYLKSLKNKKTIEQIIKQKSINIFR